MRLIHQRGDGAAVGGDGEVVIAIGIAGNRAKLASGIRDSGDLKTLKAGELFLNENQDAATVGQPFGTDKCNVVGSEEEILVAGIHVDGGESGDGVAGIIDDTDDDFAVGRPDRITKIGGDGAAGQGG